MTPTEELERRAELNAQDADYWQQRAETAEAVCEAIEHERQVRPSATIPFGVLVAFSEWKASR